MHTYRDRIIQPDKVYMMQTNSVRSDYSSAVRTVNQANQGWQRLNAKPRKGGHWRVSVKLAGIHDYSTDRLPDSDRLWQPWHILVAEQRSPREGVGHTPAQPLFLEQPIPSLYCILRYCYKCLVPTSISITLYVVIRA